MPGVIFLIALAVRLVCLGVFYGFGQPDPITAKYLMLADKLVANGWIYPDVFAYSPVYMYFVAITRAAFGGDLISVLVVQSVVGATAVTVLYLLARQMFGPVVGLISGASSAFYHEFLLYDTEFYSDSLAALLQWSALLFALKAGVRRSASMATLSGVFIGLASLQRPTALAFLPFVVTWLLVNPSSEGFMRKLSGALSAVLGAALMVLPVTLHNRLVGGDSVLILSQGGYVLYSSNNHRSTGAQYFPPTVRLEDGVARIGPWTLEDQSFYDDELMSRYTASKVVRRELLPSEASSFWIGETKKYAAANPREFVELLGRKVLFTFHAFKVHDLYSIRAKVGEFGNPLWELIGWILVPAGLVGLITSITRWRDLWLVYAAMAASLAQLLAFYIATRFMLPLLGLWIIFAAFFFVQIFRLIGANGFFTKRVISRLGVFAALVVLLSWNYPPIEQQERMELAAQWVSEGQKLIASQPDRAIERLTKAAQLQPLSPKAFEAHRLLRQIQLLQGRPDLAAREEQILQMREPNFTEELTKRLQRNPNDQVAMYTWGLVCLQRGEFCEAASSLADAVRLKPSHPRRWTHWAQALIHCGPQHYEAALDALEKALDIGEKFEAESTLLHLKAALLGVRLGQSERALPHFEQCLFESPDFLDARVAYHAALTELGRSVEAERQWVLIKEQSGDLATSSGDMLAIDVIERRYLFR